MTAPLKHSDPITVEVALGERAYDIVIGRDVLQSLGARVAALRPGVPWSERMTGTNAIGTAMIEGRAVEVRGAEHFFAPHRVLSCSAVPIIDPFGKIAGVMDLSGEASVHHVHALGMVRLVVDQIERRLFEREFPGCRVLRESCRPGW